MKYNRDLRSGNVDKVDYHDPSANLIDSETLKTYYFDCRKKHHLPVQQRTIKAYSLADAIRKLDCVWYRQRENPPTK